jgi:adenosylhomocysteine nucleosidase
MTTRSQSAKSTCALLLFWSVVATTAFAADKPIVVLVSANAEWKPVLERHAGAAVKQTPYGDWFTTEVGKAAQKRSVIFMHGGFGKVQAAASTQYAIDQFHPALLVNLGTCGGFEGTVSAGEVVLVEKTIIYDLIEQMGDSQETIDFYSTPLDTKFAGATLPKGVRRGMLLSADRDIVAADVPALKRRFKGIAADWESGAIAFVARKNGTPLFILREVSDVVHADGGDAFYGDDAAWQAGAKKTMNHLVDLLPEWLDRWGR